MAAFVEDCLARAKKPATVRRYLATIALAHRVAKLRNPCDDDAVRLELLRLTQAM
ncbi:MAG: hypothetical protein IPG25_06265 [Proteobacteria bacterium]|nr:hypothetical protein [Pseudomonadota bacterium]